VVCVKAAEMPMIANYFNIFNAVAPRRQECYIHVVRGAAAQLY